MACVWSEESSVSQAPIVRCSRRTIRLLASLSELHWEVWDSTLRNQPSVSQIEHEDVADIEQREDKAEHEICAARRVEVPHNELTEEFRILVSEHSGLDEDGIQIPRHQRLLRWIRYKEERKIRNEWALLLSSNLDWDWDPSESLRYLYQINIPDLPTDIPIPVSHIATVDADGVQDGVWILETQLPQTISEMPKKLRIRYRSIIGEIRYMEYTCPSEDPDTVPTEISRHGNKADKYMKPPVYCSKCSKALECSNLFPLPRTTMTNITHVFE